MGFCFSCCRRRSNTGDREPLLPRQASITESLPPAKSQVDKVADALAAFRAGKLPSQDQTNAAMRKLLHSEVLAIESSKSARIMGQGQQYGPLSERGITVLKDVRELVEAVIQFGMEKNDDDRVQDLIYQNSRMGATPVSVDLNVAAENKETAEDLENLATAVPSSNELDDDARRISHSLLTISRLLLTSSTFRLLLSDVLLTSRALLADVAADVGRVARTVELKAEAVEEAVRPPASADNGNLADDMEKAGKQVQEGLGEIGDETKADWQKLGEESPDRVKDAVLERLQKVLSQAQQTPTYKSALTTLLYVVRKYAEKTSIATSALSSMSASIVSATPVITADPHLTYALTDLRVILERMASGRSLSAVLSYAEGMLRDVVYTSSPTFKSELRQYFEEVGSYLDTALSEPGFPTSSQGHRSAERLYERGRSLMQSETNAPWAEDARKLLDEVESFTHAVSSDKTTRRVVDSLDNLSTHTANLGQAAAGASVRGQKAWREEIKRDAIGWVIPRVLKMLKTIPMPRVELKSDAPNLELVIDSLVLTAASASFVPDHVTVQNWSEIRVEASAAALDHAGGWQNNNQGSVTSSTRTRVHLDGLRIAAHRIGYYVHYKGPLGGLISWEDNGLLSIDVGMHDISGEGLSMDIELETTPREQKNSDSDASLFQVNDVKIDVPGLRLSIDNSRHWLFNKLLLQPLAGPVIRRELGNILAEQIRTSLESLNEKLSLVRKEANERVESNQDEMPSLEDYWHALFTTIGSAPDDETEDEGPEPLVETDTHVTLKGVVWNTRTQIEPESSSPGSPSETVVAVGVGAQILPGKGGPEQDMNPVADQARDALAELEGAAGNAAGKVRDVGSDAIGTAVEAREQVEEASARMEVREDLERRRKGWRSRAFDL